MGGVAIHSPSFFVVFLGGFFFLFRPCLWYMEVPRLGVTSELQLPAKAISHSNARPKPSL